MIIYKLLRHLFIKNISGVIIQFSVIEIQWGSWNKENGETNKEICVQVMILW